MKSIYSICLVSLLAILSFSCQSASNSNNTEAVSEPMSEFDLKKHGLSVSISLPKSKMHLLIDSMQTYGDLTLEMGKTFNLNLTPLNTTIADIKKDISANDVNKFKKYITEEDNTLMYESEIVAPEYHFYHITTIGNEKWLISDKINTEGTPYSEKEVQLMLECAKSIQSK
jgi:hypothetical protein